MDISKVEIHKQPLLPPIPWAVEMPCTTARHNPAFSQDIAMVMGQSEHGFGGQLGFQVGPKG